MEKTHSVEVATLQGEPYIPYDPFEFEMDVVPPSAPPSTKRSNAFVKTKEGKLRYALVPITAWKEVVKVFMFGAEKHEPFGWKGVPDARTHYYEAAMRHLTDWYEGQEEDPESGLHPLAHLACDALILLARKIDGTL